MSERFEALILDFGGVLTTPLQDAMAAFAEALGIELQDFVRVALGLYAGQTDSLVHDFETGTISEEEFSKALARRLQNVSGTPVDPDGLVRKIFRVNLEESMLVAVEMAHAAGVRTAMLSNSWGTTLYPRERLGPLFDEVVISGEVGIRKPDPAIFRLTADRLRVPAERSIFVDDEPGHLTAAGRLGYETVLHSSPKTTIPRLEELLARPLSRRQR